MPRTNFVTKSTVSPAFFNAVKEPIMDGQDLDGHGPKIIDDWLSDDPGAIKARFNTINNSFLVTAATGRNVNVQGGAITLEDNTIATVANTSLSLPADTTSFIWVNQAGVVEFGSRLPVRCLPLASVTTITNAIAVNGLVDLRPRFRVLPAPRSLSAFGGAATQDITISTNTVANNVIRCRNFTLAAGVTLSSPSGQVRIIASGNVVINGIITVSPPVAGAPGFSGATNAQYYVISEGKGPGGGAGTNAPAPSTYSWEISELGSGGASGFVIAGGAGTVVQSRGGNGGGSILIQAAGSIQITGQLSARGGNAVVGSATGAGSWQVSGGGGGSGGSIVLLSLTSITGTAASQFDVRGGDGAPGATLNGGAAAGGGGGGGGWLVARSPLNNFTGATTQLTGGAAGVSSPPGTGIACGAGGTFAGAGGPSAAQGTAGAAGLTFFDNLTPV